MMRALLPVLLMLCLAPLSSAQAAVGCSLRDPDADIRRFFPSMTDYSVHYVTYARQAPDHHKELAHAIGDELDAVYETPDVPYTLYVVNSGRSRLGYVFGTNQRGRYSNIQVIAVLNTALELQQVYIQKIRSPAYELFQSEAFGRSLATVPLAEFPAHVNCYRDGQCADFPVADPTRGEQAEDFRAILRGLAKLHNLSTGLLLPGLSPVPRSDLARAEWIGNVGGAEPSRQVNDRPQFQPQSEVTLEPEAPVVLWLHAEGNRVFPLDVLQHTPIVRMQRAGQPYLLAWSDSSGTAAVFQTDQALEMTSDQLFGVRLLADPKTGSRVSPVLGATVYGDSEFSLSMEPGVGVVTAAEAYREAPDATVLQLPPHLISAPVPVLPVGERVRVERSGNQVEAWRESSLADPSAIPVDSVQFWMTLEGYKSTFPQGKLH